MGGGGGKEGIRMDRGMGLISYPTPSLLFSAFSHLFCAVLYNLNALNRLGWESNPQGADPGFLLGEGVPLRNGVTDW